MFLIILFMYIFKAICQHFLGFEVVDSYRIKDYIHEGRNVFYRAKDDDIIYSMKKYV